MTNPNKILAKKIYDALCNKGFLSSDIDEEPFTRLLETGKMQVKDWDNSLAAPNNQNSYETTEATD